MNSLVIGSGSIAQRHIKNLISLNHKPSFLTTSEDRLKKLSNIFSIKGYLSVDDALDDNDCVIIANPTHLHEYFLYKSFEKRKTSLRKAVKVHGLLKTIRRISLIRNYSKSNKTNYNKYTKDIEFLQSLK